MHAAKLPDGHFHDGFTGGVFVDCPYCNNTQVVSFASSYQCEPIICENCNKPFQEPTHYEVLDTGNEPHGYILKEIKSG